MKKNDVEKQVDTTENNDAKNKKRPWKYVFIVCALGMAVFAWILFVSLIIPAQSATEKYNTAVENYNIVAEKYNDAAEKTSLVNIDGLITKADTLDSASESYIAVIKSVMGGNSKEKILKDVATLEEMIEALEANVKIVEQITVPDEAWLIERVQSVDGVQEVEAVTDDNDPNGMLNKKDGYVSCIYFSYDKVDDSSVPGDSIIGKGTDCGGAIESYGTLEEAENRVEYLKGFDDTILYSGSYAIVGTMVIRTSYLLTDDEQYDLTDAITQAITKIK